MDWLSNERFPTLDSVLNSISWDLVGKLGEEVGVVLKIPDMKGGPFGMIVASDIIGVKVSFYMQFSCSRLNIPQFQVRFT